MIGFSRFLAEVFDKPVSYTKEVGNNHVNFNFNVKNNPYQVYIGSEEGRFRFKGGEQQKVRYAIVLSYRGTGSKSEFNLTNLKDDRFAVLATTKKIIFDYFDNKHLNDGDWIEFDTFEPRTAKLYTKFAQELAKRTKTTIHTTTDWENRIEFVLTK